MYDNRLRRPSPIERNVADRVLMKKTKESVIRTVNYRFRYEQMPVAKLRKTD